MPSAPAAALSLKLDSFLNIIFWSPSTLKAAATCFESRVLIADFRCLSARHSPAFGSFDLGLPT